MPKRGYTPEEHQVLNKLRSKYGTEGSAWKAIEKEFNEEIEGYPRTAGALRTEYFRQTELRGGPKKDKTIQGIMRKLGIVEQRLSRLLRRSAESESAREDRKEKRELRKKNRDLKRSNRALEAELGKVRRALRPFQRAIERAQSARVVHSETNR